MSSREGEQGGGDVPLPSPFPPCQGLSRVRDGLLVGEIDLNLVRQVRDKWSFPVSALGAGGVFRLDPPPPFPPPDDYATGHVCKGTLRCL